MNIIILLLFLHYTNAKKRPEKKDFQLDWNLHTIIVVGGK